MVGCKCLHLYWSGAGRTSQETAISGSFHQALLGVRNSMAVCCLQVGNVPKWGCLWMAFPSVSVLIFGPLCHGSPRSSMGSLECGSLKARWVRIHQWQTETNIEAGLIWVYFAALKLGFLYIKNIYITTLKRHVQSQIPSLSFGTVKHKNQANITTLKRCIQWITKRTGSITIYRNHPSVTTLKAIFSHPRLVAYFQEQINMSLWSIIF